MIKMNTLLYSLLMLLVLAGCDGTKSVIPEPDLQSKRHIHSGDVIGFSDSNNTHVWRGIPYAQAPVGDLRWQAPRPVPAGKSELSALAFSDMCVQSQFPLEPSSDDNGGVMGSEDCLYLNVAAPRFEPTSIPQGEQRLPVMVWIHGGGNTVGSASHYAAFNNLAGREQLITVSINYRLGVFGWLSHPAIRATSDNALDASGNYGTLDAIAALQWVQENISAFGGDPNNVTIFGESAGAFNVFALLQSPVAKGLFHRAIAQSGFPQTFTRARAENYIDDPEPGMDNSASELIVRLLLADGRAKDRAEARALHASMAPEDLLAYLRQQSIEAISEQLIFTPLGLYAGAFIIRDGQVIPDAEAIELFASSDTYNSVPTMLGTTRDEMKTFMMADSEYVDQYFGVLPWVLDPERYHRDAGYVSSMWKYVGADQPARAMIESGNPDVYVYRFDWDEIPGNLFFDMKAYFGAGHALEIPFVMADYENENSVLPMIVIDGSNRKTAVPLGDAMSSYWSAFAYNGDPGKSRDNAKPRWTPYANSTSINNNLIFDSKVDGGIRMQTVSLERSDIIERMREDTEHLSGDDGLCATYRKVFWEKVLFRFFSDREEYLELVEKGCPPIF